MSLARRQRDKPSNHEIQPNDCFDPAFEGEQGVGPAFDQRRLSLLTPKMGRTRLSASMLRGGPASRPLCGQEKFEIATLVRLQDLLRIQPVVASQGRRVFGCRRLFFPAAIQRCFVDK